MRVIALILVTFLVMGCSIHSKKVTVGILSYGDALHVTQVYWKIHEKAIDKSDNTTYLGLFDPPALDVEQQILSATPLSAFIHWPHPIVDTQIYMPAQTNYPLRFVADIKYKALDADGQVNGAFLNDVDAFEQKSAKSPWKVIGENLPSIVPKGGGFSLGGATKATKVDGTALQADPFSGTDKAKLLYTPENLPVVYSAYLTTLGQGVTPEGFFRTGRNASSAMIIAPPGSSGFSTVAGGPSNFHADAVGPISSFSSPDGKSEYTYFVLDGTWLITPSGTSLNRRSCLTQDPRRSYWEGAVPEGSYGSIIMNGRVYVLAHIRFNKANPDGSKPLVDVTFTRQWAAPTLSPC